MSTSVLQDPTVYQGNRSRNTEFQFRRIIMRDFKALRRELGRENKIPVHILNSLLNHTRHRMRACC